MLAWASLPPPRLPSICISHAPTHLSITRKITIYGLPYLMHFRLKHTFIFFALTDSWIPRFGTPTWNFLKMGLLNFGWDSYSWQRRTPRLLFSKSKWEPCIQYFEKGMLSVILFCLVYSWIQAASRSKTGLYFPNYEEFFPHLRIFWGVIPKFKRNRLYPKKGNKITSCKTETSWEINK